jgi:hypothetical protein
MGFVLAAAYWQAVRHGYPRREDGSSALPAFPAGMRCCAASSARCPA